ALALTDPFPDDATNPRLGLLDAEAAVATGKLAMKTTLQTVQLARDDFDLKQKLAKSGTIPAQVVNTAKQALLKEEARLDQVKLDLDQAERRAALAREQLQAKIRILEIDVADAHLRLESATKEEARARTLQERKVLAQEEYDQKRLAVDEAKLQVERNET